MSNSPLASSAAAVPQRTFLGHPLGLYVLFFSEMWERFSFYGMRALLILYMVDFYKWSQSEASTVYKWYTSLVYLTPLVGGYLADRYLGNKRAVIIGSILMAIGQFLLTFEHLSIFFIALTFMIVGNGFFKPNMSTQVGRLYPQNDPRRDGAYTIFYMGINLGAFLSPLVCGWLAANTLGGRHTGFMAAGIGMLFGLLVYLVGLRWVIELQPTGDGSMAVGGDDRIPPTFVQALRDLQAQSQTAGGEPRQAQVQIAEVPSQLAVRLANLGEQQIRYDPTTRMLTTAKPLTEQDVQRILQGIRVAEAPVPSRIIGGAISEEKAEQTPSVVPHLNRIAPSLCFAAGFFLIAAVAVLGIFRGIIALLESRQSAVPSFLPSIALTEYVANNTLISLGIVAICALIAGWILTKSRQASRDRVLTIYVLGLFVVFFWAAFEQAGNVLNIWADKATNRYLTVQAPPPPIYPESTSAKPQEKAEESEDETETQNSGLGRWIYMWRLKPAKAEDAGKKSGLLAWFKSLWNPVPTEWFQSINALGIFLIAPIFAWMWTALDRRGLNPSVPAKMAIGLILMALAFAPMLIATQRENQPSSVSFSGPLPTQIKLNDQRQLCSQENNELKPYQFGRLTYDEAAHTLNMEGVLADTERDHLVRDTAPDSFVKTIKELQQKSQQAQGNRFSVSVKLDPVPPGFDMRYVGSLENNVSYNEADKTLTAKNIKLADKDVKTLLVCGGEPTFRDAVNSLFQQSGRFRVSPWWLVWYYLIATCAELCLSPVGLSMVSKLAPAKFATMLMGLWLLTNFFGNFAAGAFGERWGEWTPTQYFLYIMALVGIAALVLILLVNKVRTMMHGVR